MRRIYNFSAGPSMLPLPVLEKAASEMTDYNGSGMSVMEMSHRSSFYEAIIEEAEKDLRKLNAEAAHKPENEHTSRRCGHQAQQRPFQRAKRIAAHNFQRFSRNDRKNDLQAYHPHIHQPADYPVRFYPNAEFFRLGDKAEHLLAN